MKLRMLPRRAERPRRLATAVSLAVLASTAYLGCGARSSLLDASPSQALDAAANGEGLGSVEDAGAGGPASDAGPVGPTGPTGPIDGSSEAGDAAGEDVDDASTSASDLDTGPWPFDASCADADLAIAAPNCGQCGAACEPGSVCTDGVCAAPTSDWPLFGYDERHSGDNVA